MGISYYEIRIPDMKYEFMGIARNLIYVIMFYMCILLFFNAINKYGQKRDGAFSYEFHELRKQTYNFSLTRRLRI